MPNNEFSPQGKQRRDFFLGFVNRLKSDNPPTAQVPSTAEMLEEAVRPLDRLMERVEQSANLVGNLENLSNAPVSRRVVLTGIAISIEEMTVGMGRSLISPSQVKAETANTSAEIRASEAPRISEVQTYEISSDNLKTFVDGKFTKDGKRLIYGNVRTNGAHIVIKSEDEFVEVQKTLGIENDATAKTFWQYVQLINSQQPNQTQLDYYVFKTGNDGKKLAGVPIVSFNGRTSLSDSQGNSIVIEQGGILVQTDNGITRFVNPTEDDTDVKIIPFKQVNNIITKAEPPANPDAIIVIETKKIDGKEYPVNIAAEDNEGNGTYDIVDQNPTPISTKEPFLISNFYTGDERGFSAEFVYTPGDEVKATLINPETNTWELTINGTTVKKRYLPEVKFGIKTPQEVGIKTDTTTFPATGIYLGHEIEYDQELQTNFNIFYFGIPREDGSVDVFKTGTAMDSIYFARSLSSAYAREMSIDLALKYLPPVGTGVGFSLTDNTGNTPTGRIMAKRYADNKPSQVQKNWKKQSLEKGSITEVGPMYVLVIKEQDINI